MSLDAVWDLSPDELRTLATFREAPRRVYDPDESVEKFVRLGLVRRSAHFWWGVQGLREAIEAIDAVRRLEGDPPVVMDHRVTPDARARVIVPCPECRHRDGSPRKSGLGEECRFCGAPRKVGYTRRWVSEERRHQWAVKRIGYLRQVAGNRRADRADEARRALTGKRTKVVWACDILHEVGVELAVGVKFKIWDRWWVAALDLEHGRWELEEDRNDEADVG